MLWVALAAAARPTHHANVFVAGDKLELRVFLSSSRAPFTDFNNTDALLWSDTSLAYSEAGSSLEKTVHVPLTERLLSNGTMFAHMFITKAGASPDPQHGSYDRLATTSNSFDLVGFSERLKPRGLYNLLTGEPAPWETELRRGLAAGGARAALEYVLGKLGDTPTNVEFLMQVQRDSSLDETSGAGN